MSSSLLMLATPFPFTIAGLPLPFKTAATAAAGVPAIPAAVVIPPLTEAAPDAAVAGLAGESGALKQKVVLSLAYTRRTSLPHIN